MDIKFDVNLTPNLAFWGQNSAKNGSFAVCRANLSAVGTQNLTGENSPSDKNDSENSGKNGVLVAHLANLNAAGEPNLKSENLSGENGASNLIKFEKGESQSSLDVLKKQLEKLQKRLKELEAAIKKANASKNPYAKDVAASLETQKGAVFARIMQISAQILQMEAGEKGRI